MKVKVYPPESTGRADELPGAAGGSGAPTNAQYVVMALDGTLTNERNLVAGAGVTITDGGANAAVTIAADPGGLGFLWSWGSGEDGALAFDGVNAVTGFTRSGSVYTATRNIMCTDAQIDSGVTVIMSSCFIMGTGTLSGAGGIENNPVDCVGSSGGTATVSGFYAGGVAGRTGGTGAGAAGANVTGGICSNGGAGGGVTGAGGVATAPTVAQGGVAAQYLLGGQFGSGRLNDNTQAGFSGGGSAGRGSGADTGGGGGPGGGGMGIFFRYITMTGTITCRGGNGGTGIGNTNGGGSGGGGALWVATTSADWQSVATVSVAAGTPGAGSGTGVAGNSGGPGRIIECIVL